MDVQTIDQQYEQLQGQSQQTVQALQTLGQKLQTAAQGGDQQAREWLLDLRELALAFRSEQDQVRNLLQSLHGYVANQAQQMPQQGYAPQGAPAYEPPAYPQQQPGYPPQQAAPQRQGGGLFGGFLNSGFGQGIAAGAGFGIAEDVIRDIF